MGYIYSVLWFLIAVILIVRFRKENPVIYVLSVYFVFLGGWWMANELIPVELVSGQHGWILRIVSVVALVIALIVYYFDKGRKRHTEQSPEKTE